MEQNLSDRERKQRLAVGMGFEVAAVIAYLNNSTDLALIFGIGGLGFIANYFTCFCGTKKAFKKLKSKLG